MTRPLLFAADSWAFLQSIPIQLLLPDSLIGAVIFPGSSSEEMQGWLEVNTILPDSLVILSIGYGDIFKLGLSSSAAFDGEQEIVNGFLSQGAHHIFQMGYNLHEELFETPPQVQTILDLECRRLDVQTPGYSYHHLRNLDPLMVMGPDGVHLTPASYLGRTAAVTNELIVRAYEEA